MNVKDSI